MRIKTHAAIWSSVMTLAVGCGKTSGDGDKADPAAATDGTTDAATDSGETDGKTDGADGAGALSDNIKKPTGALALALGSMESIMATDISSQMVGAGAALTGEEGFTEADCDEHADPKWRDGDDVNMKDNSDRLRLDHPRAALQTLYCQLQKDTGSADSFLGAISQNKLLFCVMKDLTFDGKPHDSKIAKAEFLACLDAQGASQEDKDDMTGDMPENIDVKITASAPAAFGKTGEWDASIDFIAKMGGGDQVLKILLKDNADTFAMAVNNNGGHPSPTDGYVVQIGKKSGEVRFESKFQRIRDADGKGSNVGWNRHARAYVKGTMDANLKFSAVTTVEGLMSDISVNAGTTMGADADAPIQMGSFWTARGGDDTGFKTNAYMVDCVYDAGANSYTCPDVNKAASWKALDSAGACNGAMTGTTCTGTDIKVAADADTAFAMEGKNAAFEKTEDWFANLAVPAYTTLTTKISE